MDKEDINRYEVAIYKLIDKIVKDIERAVTAYRHIVLCRSNGISNVLAKDTGAIRISQLVYKDNSQPTLVR